MTAEPAQVCAEFVVAANWELLLSERLRDDNNSQFDDDRPALGRAGRV